MYSPNLRRNAVQLVLVKTLDQSAAYPPYERTRAFWKRLGFIQGRPNRSASRMAAGEPRGPGRSQPGQSGVMSIRKRVRRAEVLAAEPG